MVLRVPVKAVSFFSHSYGQLQGDPRAASGETLKLIAKGKVDFPVNGAMVLEAADKFAATASGIILGRQHTF
jgi:hypothetical protein